MSEIDAAAEGIGGEAGRPIDYRLLAVRRRQVVDCYSRVRSAADPRIAWEMWRGELALIRSAGERPDALPTFAYDPAWRCLGTFTPSATLLVAAEPVDVLRIGVVTVEPPGGGAVDLEMYWVDGYPGGSLLPFSDPTSGVSTAEPGRCLLDQSVGADLGDDGDRWVIDFNFAYDAGAGANPFMAIPRFATPNRIPMPVLAGERLH